MVRRAAALTVLVLVLGPCSIAPKPAEVTPVAPHLVGLDSSAWDQGGERTLQAAGLGGVAGRDRLVVGIVDHGDDTASLRAWAGGLGQSSGTGQELPDVGGYPTAVAADGVGGLVVVAGTVLRSGVAGSYLLTSTDRASWSSVELDPALQAARVVAVGVADPRTVVVAGNGAEGTAVTVGTRHDEAWTTTTIGAGDEGSVQLTGVAGRGERVVVSAQLTSAGAASTPVVYVSGDRGVTFDGPQVVAEPGAYVAGVVATADGFVATGSRPVDGTSRPAAWASQLGSDWAADPEGLPADLFREDDDAWLGSPVRAGDVVAAPVLSSTSAGVLAVTRDRRGWWVDAATDDVLAVSGQGAIALPNDRAWPTAIVLCDGATLRESVGKEVVDLVSATVPAVLSELMAGPDDRAWVARRSLVFERDPDGGWWQTQRVSQGVVTGDGAAATSWGPPGLDGDGIVLGATDPETDVSVVVQNRLADDGFAPTVFVSATDEAGDDRWVEGTGFDPVPLRLAQLIRRVGNEWVLATVDAADGNRAPRRASLWTSSDGVRWVPAVSAMLPPGALESSTTDVCGDGDTLVAVGTVLGADGRERAAWWRRAGGQWSVHTAADRRAWLSQCTLDESGLVVSGYLDGAPATWTVMADELRLDSTQDRGSHRGRSTQVGDLQVAGGSIDTTEATVPVVWYSADGQDWEHLALPVTARTAGDVQVVELDGHALVAVSTTGHTHLWELVTS